MYLKSDHIGLIIKNFQFFQILIFLEKKYGNVGQNVSQVFGPFGYLENFFKIENGRKSELKIFHFFGPFRHFRFLKMFKNTVMSK